MLSPQFQAVSLGAACAIGAEVCQRVEAALCTNPDQPRNIALDIFSAAAGKSASSSGSLSWGKARSDEGDADDFVVLAKESDPLVPLTIFTTTTIVACASYICSGINSGALRGNHPARLIPRGDFASLHERCFCKEAGVEIWSGSREIFEEMSVRRETVAEVSFKLSTKQDSDELTAPICVLPLKASQIDEGHTSIVYLGHEAHTEKDASSGSFTAYLFLVEAVDVRVKKDMHRRRRRIRWLIASEFFICEYTLFSLLH